jgi:hypothetical protein
MKRLDIKLLLNSIAAKDEEIASPTGESGSLSINTPGTWDGDITKENIPSVFGLDQADPSQAGMIKWLLGLFGMGTPSDKKCMKLLLKSRWFQLLRDFWVNNHSNHTPEGLAETAIQGAKWAFLLNQEMLAAGCFKGTLLKVLEHLLQLNDLGKRILEKGIKKAQESLENLHDVLGYALAAKGPEYSQAYATALALHSAGVGGTNCSIDINTGDVVAAAAVIAIIVAAFFVAGPIGGAAATILAGCGVASADQVESIRDRARQLNDRYLGISPSETSEEYVDDVVDPTGLSDVEDFSEDGSLGNG